MAKKTKKEVVFPIDENTPYAKQRLKRIQREGLAAVAASDFESAMIYVIRTLNLCENSTIPWSLPADAKERAEDLCRELTELFHNNIIPRVERLTRRDPGFQRFLGDLTP